MIHYLRNRYYWYNINKRLSRFFDDQPQERILLYGHPKSGNTWLRLLMFNYKSLLIDPLMEGTITYDMLNRLQKNVVERGTTFAPEPGFPILYRSHKSYASPFDLFSFRIFIHRNPLDTLISSYYYYRDRDIPFKDFPSERRKDLLDIDFYVRYNIDSWIDFYYESLKHAHIIINYSDLKTRCSLTLSELIRRLDWQLDEDLVLRSVEMSSFSAVQKMGRDTQQMYGNGPRDGTFQGEFTRSGEEGQFYTELDNKTILYVLDQFPDFKRLYPSCDK